MALTRIGEITVDGDRITLSRTTYPDGSSAAVVGEVADTGEPYGKLSVYVRGVDLEPGSFVVKQYAENEKFAAAAWASGLFVDTGRKVQVGNVPAKAPVWRIKA